MIFPLHEGDLQQYDAWIHITIVFYQEHAGDIRTCGNMQTTISERINISLYLVFQSQ